MSSEEVSPHLTKSLERAIVRANVGTVSTLPLGRRASHALRNMGIGWKVDLSSAASVRRAIVTLNNGKG
tara:strand:+ start:15383 stop:15589 length:207 start_codon:yes stop_codon:yes gene_type:complete